MNEALIKKQTMSISWQSNPSISNILSAMMHSTHTHSHTAYTHSHTSCISHSGLSIYLHLYLLVLENQGCLGNPPPLSLLWTHRCPGHNQRKCLCKWSVIHFIFYALSLPNIHNHSYRILQVLKHKSVNVSITYFRPRFPRQSNITLEI